MSKNERNGKYPLWVEIVSWVIFPIGLFRLLYTKLSQRFHLSISAKVSLLNGVLFFFTFLGYAIFIIANVAYSVGTGHAEHLVNTLVVGSFILVPVLVALFVAFATLTSKSMLSPVRKMINKMDEITAESLSSRLDPVDSQDELMELTDRINLMLDDIEKSFRRQRNFVSDASHELRTPIAVVQGYSDMLYRWGKNDTAVLNEGLLTLRAEATNMSVIVEQLLHLARLGSFKPSPITFDLAEAVRDIVESYRQLGVDRLITVFAPDTVTVHADRSLVVELIRIVTDNAIKYTNAGGEVEIKAFVEDGTATVSVRDDGIGIPEEDLSKIFERFFRCDKVRSREGGGGVGLGLAIAKSIADMLHGDITVTSALGEGSTFVITLPFVE